MLPGHIDSKSRTANYIKKQTTKLTIISGYRKDAIWRNRCMSTKSKIRIYKECVRPVLTCTTENRTKTSQTKRMVWKTEIKVIRTIKGIKLRNTIRNEHSLREVGVQNVVGWIRAQRRMWRDHVDRMVPRWIVKWAKPKNLKRKGHQGGPLRGNMKTGHQHGKSWVDIINRILFYYQKHYSVLIYVPNLYWVTKFVGKVARKNKIPKIPSHSVKDWKIDIFRLYSYQGYFSAPFS